MRDLISGLGLAVAEALKAEPSIASALRIAAMASPQVRRYAATTLRSDRRHARP